LGGAERREIKGNPPRSRWRRIVRKLLTSDTKPMADHRGEKKYDLEEGQNRYLAYCSVGNDAVLDNRT